MNDEQNIEHEGNGRGGETIEERVKQARDEIGVRGRGVTPETYGQVVTVANDISQADELVQDGIRRKRALIAAITRIAYHAQASPDLFAMTCYVEKGRLCLTSAGFHILAIRYLEGPLVPVYEGEGEERRVTVKGKLKGDPNVYEWSSPPLGKLHPGHVTKDGKKFVKGSPEWDRKPDKQLFYDTRRDWIRMYCPQAIGGFIGVEEIDELPPLKDVTPRPGVHDRLDAGDRAKSSEGFRGEDHVREELDRIAAAEAPTKWVVVLKGTTLLGVKYVEDTRLELPEEVADEMIAQGTAVLPTGPSQAPAKPPAEAAQAAPKAKKGSRKPPAAKTSQRAPEPRQKPPAKKAATPDPKPQEVEAGTTTPAAKAYIERSIAWIAAAQDPDEIVKRWDGEWDDRNEIGVRIADRRKLEEFIDARVAELRRER